jgi:hypothetical protein
MQRRGFLLGMLAAGAAPAVVRSGVLMPVRPAIITDVSMTISEYLAIDQGCDHAIDALQYWMRWALKEQERMCGIAFVMTA